MGHHRKALNDKKKEITQKSPGWSLRHPQLKRTFIRKIKSLEYLKAQTSGETIIESRAQSPR